MIKKKIILLLCCFLGVVSACKSQIDFFHEFEANKNFTSKNNKYQYIATANWKHFYGGVNWNRLGLNGQVRRRFNQWLLMGGLINIYTYDKDIANYYELRPFIGVGLNTPVGNALQFGQMFRAESRTFFFKNSDLNETNVRLRYNLNLTYTFKENTLRETAWRLRGETEWYILKEQQYQERFVSSNENTIKIIRAFTKNKELALAYRVEKFNANFNTEDNIAHTVAFEYNF